MKTLFWVVLIVFLLSMCRAARADNTELTHFTEHFVASTAIYTGSYLFMHDVLGCSKTDSFIFGAFTTLLIGFTYKYLEQMDQNSSVNFTRPMIYNGVGVVIPAVVLWHFDL